MRKARPGVAAGKHGLTPGLAVEPIAAECHSAHTPAPENEGRPDEERFLAESGRRAHRAGGGHRPFRRARLPDQATPLYFVMGIGIALMVWDFLISTRETAEKREASDARELPAQR